MENYTLNQFADAVKNLSVGQEHLPETLKLFDDGHISSYYAPFEHVNTRARLVICGITPGHHQASVALTKAAECLKAGQAIEEAQEAAKNTASFSGAMRNSLVRMMDNIGLNTWLDIDTCAQLFTTHTHLVHYTSALRYPVFKNSENYNGTPSMTRHGQLREMIDTCLAQEARTLGPKTLWLPLGTSVTEGLEYLTTTGALQPGQILSGLPHPSGANAERIKIFLGEKRPEDASVKTNPAKLLEARQRLLDKLHVA